MEARTDPEKIYDLCRSLLVVHVNQTDLAKIAAVTTAVQSLSEAGAKADYCHDKFTAYPTALHYAAKYGDPQLIKLLIYAGARLDKRGGIRDLTALDILGERLDDLRPPFNTLIYQKQFGEIVVEMRKIGFSADQTAHVATLLMEDSSCRLPSCSKGITPP